MPRTLTVARARVDPADEAEYLLTVRELARLGDGRGRHLWLFRSRSEPALFLECSESGDAGSHRTTDAPPDDERRLDARLRELASYEPDARELWEEA